MIEFREKKEYLQYKGYSAKAYSKDESILSPILIIETDINDKVTSDNNEDYPWPKDTYYTYRW